MAMSIRNFDELENEMEHFNEKVPVVVEASPSKR